MYSVSVSIAIRGVCPMYSLHFCHVLIKNYLGNLFLYQLGLLPNIWLLSRRYC
jgi:hypothetical protein